MYRACIYMHLTKQCIAHMYMYALNKCTAHVRTCILVLVYTAVAFAALLRVYKPCSIDAGHHLVSLVTEENTRVRNAHMT